MAILKWIDSLNNYELVIFSLGVYCFGGLMYEYFKRKMWRYK
jgi:hypothetical protein